MINKVKKLLVFILLFAFFVSEFRCMNYAYAANLRFYNYSTGSNVNYSDKQVIYTYNNRELPLTYPGILINGTALADYEELFVRELGLSAERKGDVITISDGSTSVKLTLGSKKVYVNGVEKSMSVAPVKLKFNDTVKYYVPTRFVSEALGYGYVWVSNISTVRITKTLSLSVNGSNFMYNGTLYSVKYHNDRISLEMPVLYYGGQIIVPAKQVFEAAGCTYSEKDNKIIITKDELSLFLEKESKIAYVNEKKIIGNSIPLLINNISSGETEVYLSLEFVTDMLGFELTYSDKEKCYSLKESELTGKLALYPDLESGMWQKSEPITEEPVKEKTPETVYYEWLSQSEGSYGTKYLSKVYAYHLDGMDIVELYGITKADIHDFYDNGFVILEMNEVVTDLDTQFYSGLAAPYLNYSLLTVLNNDTRLYFMTSLESTWHITEQDGVVRVYFTEEDLTTEDLSISSVNKETPQIQEIVTTEYNYPDDKIIIPLHESIKINHISDVDMYSSHSFTINITGNYADYFNENPIINPYYGIDISKPQYDNVNNLTKITFKTNSLCGYSYTFEDGYLALNVGKPSEIYSKIVVFDAGHGGNDPGAIKDGIYEKNINFKIINTYVKELFEQSDIKVYFTREKDVKIDLYDRAAFASEVGADMFISLHLNAHTSGSIRGTEVYYSKENNKKTESGFNSYQLAKILSQNLSVAMDTKNRGATNNDFVVTKYNTVPAVLIELGYMTNATELSKLKDTVYQQKAAKAIYDTVVQIYNEHLLR